MSDFPINTNFTFVENIATTGDGSRQIELTTTTAHVKGPWKELIASTGFDYHALIVRFRRGNAGKALLDIAIGGSGSEQIIFENMMVQDNGANGSEAKFLIPYHIPEGTRIAARIQHVTGGSNSKITIKGFGGTFETDGCGQKAFTYGAVTGTTDGTLVDPGATQGVYGSWVELTSSCDNDIRQLLLFCADPTNNTQTNYRFRLEVGIGSASNETLIIGNYSLSGNSFEKTNSILYALPVDIPAGTRISVRCKANISASPNRLTYIILTGVS